MYALAHLAYFNLENKHKLSQVETYKLIMDLLKVMIVVTMCYYNDDNNNIRRMLDKSSEVDVG